MHLLCLGYLFDIELTSLVKTCLRQLSKGLLKFLTWQCKTSYFLLCLFPLGCCVVYALSIIGCNVSQLCIACIPDMPHAHNCRQTDLGCSVSVSAASPWPYLSTSAPLLPQLQRRPAQTNEQQLQRNMSIAVTATLHLNLNGFPSLFVVPRMSISAVIC